MNLHSLKPGKGAKKKRKRVGRGNASGHGTTATRGTKGQLSTSGGGKGPGFEGGQLPLQRRLPRLPGFTNIFKTQYQIVNIDRLNKFENNTEINPDLLYESRIVRKKTLPVKILGDGELTKSLNVKAHAFSATASESIKKAGGKAEVIA
jgi:large subunit ribosomal protein L15